MNRLLLFPLIVVAAQAQGPLTPPPGPPGPTMKSLDQVEPRIPLTEATAAPSASSAYVISQPGSYFLTGNVAAGGKASAITIQGTGVTLDLSGYSVSGASSQGIRLTSGAGATIRNGFIDAAGATHAIRAEGSLTAEDLSLRGSVGNLLEATAPASLRRCLLEGAAGGAYLGGGASRVVDSIIRDISGGSGVILRGDGSEVRDSQLARITVTAPYAQAIDMAGSGHRVFGNRIGPVGGRGILAVGSGHEVSQNHIVVVPGGPALEADSTRTLFTGNTFSTPGFSNGRIKGQDGGGNTAFVAGNSAPTAVISSSTPTVNLNQVASLSGANSLDPEQDALTYDWVVSEQPAGGTGVIQGSGVNVSLQGLNRGGIYRVKLVVTDALGLSSNPDLFAIGVVDNVAPTAVLSQVTTPAKTGDKCILRCSNSTDQGGQVTRYTFTLITKPASSALSTTPVVRNTSDDFEEFVPDKVGTYRWRLVVRDDSGNDSVPTEINVVVNS